MSLMLKARLARVEIHAGGYLSLVAAKMVVDEETSVPLEGVPPSLHRQTGQASNADLETFASAPEELLAAMNMGLIADGYPPIESAELAQFLSVAHG